MVGPVEPESSATSWVPFIARMSSFTRRKTRISTFLVSQKSLIQHLVENTLSGDYVMITITSLFRPTTTEVWMKHAGKDMRTEKFWLVQPMQQGVRYWIKHSGEFLYKMSNEEDRMNYKVGSLFAKSL
jgi:protease II